MVTDAELIVENEDLVRQIQAADAAAGEFFKRMATLREKWDYLSRTHYLGPAGRSVERALQELEK